MSRIDGWAAIHLEMPDRVPRTEYSVEGHYELIARVTGILVDARSDEATRTKARNAFFKAWNYGFYWTTKTGPEIFGDHCTKMGHAVYQADGSDFSQRITCPFPTVESVLSFDPEHFYTLPPHAELVAGYEEHYAYMCKTYPDLVNMTGIYVSCVSGLIEMFGWDMLLTALGEDAEAFGEVTRRYGRLIARYFEALADADVPVVMIHDDLVWTSGAFASPAWYRQYVFPVLKRCIAPLIESGKRIAFTSDGNFTEFIDDIAACGVSGFVLEPSTDMKYIAERYGKTHFFIGNADTRVLLSGSRQQIQAEVKRCMDIGKPCPGFMLAVGNHIPANTPIENALWYHECYERMAVR